MEECIFCDIRDGKSPSYRIWENNDFLAFMNIYPINPGHILLIPKQHEDYIFDLKEPLYSELFKKAKEIAIPLKKALKPKRVALVVEGFGVPHIHIHLIPINTPGDLDPRRARQASEQELEEARNNIFKEIKKAFK